MNQSARHRACVALVVALFAISACAPQPQPREPATPVTDDALSQRVRAALNTGGLDAAEIDVSTTKGIVRLTGFARDQQTIERAETTVRRVQGVAAVINEIQLRGGNPERRR